PSSLTPLPSPVLADDSREHMELLLSGLVVNQGGRLVVKNPIYQAVFNAQWVSKQLTHLRPYSQTFDAWIAAQGQDESCLLRGQALQDALAWAMGKSLSDLDYQFLGASQDLAKRQAQTALEAVEQASQILATARQRAKQEFLKLRIGWGWIPLVATGVSVPILLLRLGGLLQGAEWNLFDQFVRWRPAEPPEQRVAIVIIDELDITKVGQWPIPDGVLAQAIKNIKAHKPRAIGLDIYRDLAVEPGHAELVNLFKSSPNLFGIEKVVQPTIAPPPVLSQLDQVGFADQVLDADGKLRRGLLSVIASDNQVRYSLAVKLALHYLEAEGLILEPLEGEPDRLRLGKAIFERFERNDGGYVRAQSGGYQILLNFRGNQEHFSTFSLRQVLANDIPPDSFRDRIVPIGTTAESINDFFYTPYSDSRFNSPKRMAGVTVHANIISEIISAALEGRALFRVWTDPIEWLWIFAWAGVGTAISWLWKSPSAIAALIIFVSSGLLGGCYLAFLLGWWLPFVPSLLVLLGSAIILPIITNKQLEKLQFRRTLAFLLEVCQDYPTAGRIAIEYLKQSESKENQTFIDRQLGNG
ncbi:MAG TPA: molecular chaperone TorD, partial [Cyanobacteria bacterium UBA8803]|nr:molecular chaperone TorD [Cyanobacteria bacterium UBA8803]